MAGKANKQIKPEQRSGRNILQTGIVLYMPTFWTTKY